MKPIEPVRLVINAIDANGNPGVQAARYAGTMLFIRKATADFSMKFDSDTEFDSEAGFKFTQNFSKVTFYNYNPFQITIDVYIGQAGVDYVGPNVTVPAPTVPKGNFGINLAGDIAKILGQKLTALAPVHHGQGYTVGDVLTSPDGTGQLFQVTVTRVDPLGGINSWAITQPGNYSILPASPCSPTGGTGNGAQFNVTFASITGANLALSATAGWLTIDNTALLAIPGGYGNNARKSITLKVAAGSAHGLLVKDGNGCTMRNLAAGEEETFKTPGQIQIISDGAGLCTFTSYELPYL